jgi:hypothetical protein
MATHRDHREDVMRYRFSIGATALAAALLAMIAGEAAAWDESKYPDLKGQWRRATNRGLLAGGAGGLRYDDSLPADNSTSLGQKPPLTPEYQAIYDANLKDMERGGQGIDPTWSCVAGGMPRIMIGYSPLEIVLTPDVTYVLMERDHDHFRRIYTDGRDFPPDMDLNPQFNGYSVGKWRDENGDGKYDVLEVETRGIQGPRVFDATGIPLHEDNQTIVQERIYIDKADPNVLHDDITTIDHALTKPWLVHKTFRRVVTDKPVWYAHSVCGQGNAHVGIGKEVYYLSGEGLLMPAIKDQPAPDLRYFKPSGR